MELFEDKEHFIIRKEENALLCSRSDGSLTARRAADVCNSALECLGVVHGVIGKLKLSSESEWKLLLVKNCVKVGTLPRGQDVYKITKVLVLTLGSCSVKDLDIEACRIHHPNKPDQNAGNTAAPKKPLQRTWNQFKQAAENIKPKKFFESFGLEASLGFKIPPLSDLVVTSGQLQKETKETKEKEKFEKKVLEELVKMFNDSESFYYCSDGDITNCIQRQQSLDPSTPFWQRADDRFFWNKYMLQDLINSKSELCRPWLVPIIQGYVQIESCKISFDDEFGTTSSSSSHENSQSDLYNLKFKLCLISRRSRHRAGTRYKRRGVDEDGNTANYVETEQILEFSNHIVSFVQVRGSVPLFWGQTGIKYKPPPRIYRDEEQNHKAFCRHFEDQLRIYKSVAAISLVDQLGKEKVISDSFLRHIITYNSPQMTYVTFDFHEYCRGMRFENISILTENIMDVLQSMGYCWVDQSGTICEQKGVFRVNCIDCLDRTNIVQSALARIVLEIQCRKLGLLSPERPLPPDYRTIYQQMWANNGDIISCQYAGTAALKGDYTRTGERRLAGMMKDGVNSANRYYINRVKDVYRQAIVDLMLGNPIVEEFDRLDSAEESEVLVEKEENLKILIDESKKMLIQEPDECLGGWGLINCDGLADEVDPTHQDMDIILLLSQKAYYVAHYDDDTDHVTSYQKIALDDLDKIEIGIMNFGTKHRQMCIRVYYRYQADAGYFHTFCTTSTRLFNNIVVGIRNQEEARESLRAICETFLAAKKLVGQNLTIEDKKLDKQKSSKLHLNTVDIASEAQVQVESSVRPKAGISRENTSENIANSHETTVTKLIHLTENQSAKLLTFGQTMAGMLPVKKMRLNSLQPKVFQMFPTVLYRKDDSTREPKVGTTIGKDAPDGAVVNSSGTEKDLICFEAGNAKENRAEEGAGGGEKKNLRLYSDLLSSSDSDLSLSDLEMTTRCQTVHFVWPSVGLLMVEPEKIVVALLKQQVAKGGSGKVQPDAFTNILDGGVKDGVLERKKALFLAQVKSRSLDVEERMSRKVEDSVDRSEVNHDLLRKNLCTDSMDDKRYGMMRRKTDKADNDKAVGSEVTDADDGKISDDAGAVSPRIIVTDPETPRHLPGLMRRHSLLKLSHSEGSLSNSLSASEENVTINIDLDELDFFDSHGPGGSALNKLRVKVANLALPAMGMPENRQKQLREQARSNRLRSQLRFREMKTRIVLL